jgi:hypothetical protein
LGLAGALCADPSSRVGRLNLIDGAVSFKPGSLDDWSVAVVNYPLTTGDSLWTGKGAQAEIHVGSAAIRLRSNTDISFLNLDDNTLQIQLTAGALDIKVRHLSKRNSIEVATPNASVLLQTVGSYRVDVKHSGNERVTVRQGQAEITVADKDFSIDSGQTAMVPQENPQGLWIQAAMQDDAFDTWCIQRDAAEDTIASTQYVPADMVGVEDLDHYGSWLDTSDYGPVWQPSGVEADWTPYSDGRWAWVEPWGWTWIDNAPWGFAPFHYGRWAHRDNGWCWVPGKAVQKTRPVYAPALVVFVGGAEPNPTWSGNGISWFPLGPHEAYVPPYHAEQTYLRNMNAFAGADVGNGTTYKPQNSYINRSVPGAVRGAASGESFGRPQTAVGSKYPIASGATTKSRILGTTAPVVPKRENVTAFVRPAGTVVEKPTEGLEQKAVVARLAPPSAPVPFAKREPALAATQGRPLEENAVKKIAQTSPTSRPAQVNVVKSQNVQNIKPQSKPNNTWWNQQKEP